MDALGALGTVTGMGVHGFLGASATTDFGKKGLYAGGAVGAASFLTGQMLTDEEDGAMGAIVSGMISGSMQSAFSTAQEIFAYHNPGSQAALGSINTTTSATAITEVMYAPFTKEGREQFKTIREGDSQNDYKRRGVFQSLAKWGEVNTLTPENILTDVTKIGMVYNDNEKGADKLLRLMGVSRDEGGFNPLTAVKGEWDDMNFSAKVADEGGPWFDKEKGTLKVEQKTFFGQKIDDNGNVLTGQYFDKSGKPVQMPTDPKKFKNLEVYGIGRKTWMEENGVDESKTQYAYKDKDGNMVQSTPAKPKPIELNGNETMNERMGKWLDANEHAYSAMLGTMAERDRAAGKDVRFENFNDYKNYLMNIEGGAHGTYLELKRNGNYDKDTPTLKKALSYGTENMYGSPHWARTLDKQIQDGKTQVENYVDDKGNKKVRLKGGGKARMVGAAADVLMGGVLNAGINLGIYGVGSLFSGGGGSQAIAANNAYNPI